MKNNSIFAVHFDCIQRSHLKNKSELLEETAELLHQKYLYPGVAHAAYYSCLQIMKNICMFQIMKSEQEFDSNVSLSADGSHEFILNEVVKFVGEKSRQDSRDLRSKMPQLKKYRVKADYKNEEFNFDDSKMSISLSKDILKILKKY